jgi:hypothetical protein
LRSNRIRPSADASLVYPARRACSVRTGSSAMHPARAQLPQDTTPSVPAPDVAAATALAVSCEATR